MPFDYSDSFSDPNGTLLHAHVPDSPIGFVWTKLGANNVTIENGRLSFPAPGSASRYRANVNTLNEDGEYEATAQILVGGANASVSAAISIVIPGTANGYRFVLSKDISGNLSFSLGRMTGGGVAALGTSGTIANPPDGVHELKIVKAGNVISGYWRGSLMLSAVDATHQGTSELTVDGNTNATHSYVMTGIFAGVFDPIVPFPDPAQPVYDCNPPVTPAVVTTMATPAAPVFTEYGGP